MELSPEVVFELKVTRQFASYGQPTEKKHPSNLIQWLNPEEYNL